VVLILHRKFVCWCCQTNANQSPPKTKLVSVRKKAAPLTESGGAWLFVVIAVLEMTLRRKVVVGCGMDRRELLQHSHAPDQQHRPLASSEWHV
jgi:hypothetical protein